MTRSRLQTEIKIKLKNLCLLPPCSLVETDLRFIYAHCLHHQGDLYLYSDIINDQGIWLCQRRVEVELQVAE